MAIWLLFLTLPLAAFADGVVVHPTAIPTPVTIPDQRALIQYSNGLERLVIETRFSGAGTNFVWVMPLPAKPDIEAVTPGIFATLAFQLRPKVIHAYDGIFPIVLFSLATSYLLLVVRRDTPLRPGDLIAVVLMGLTFEFVEPFIAPFVSLVMFLTVYRIRRGSESPWVILLALVAIFFFSGLLLPALGTAGSSASPAVGINELERKTVGVFDVSTIQSREPSALLDWLRENQFEIPPNASNVVADYVRRGWVFTVARLHRDETGMATNAIHPLSFTFPAAAPVYPMRLTGLNHHPLNVELFVFGNEEAGAKDFNVERCARVEFPEKSPYRFKPPVTLPVMHSQLRKWLAGSMVVTRLTATLTPEQMQEDVVFKWKKFEPLQKEFYSRRGAALTAADRVSLVALGAFLITAIASAFTGNRVRMLNRSIAAISGVVLLIFMSIYFSLPKIPVRSVRFPSAMAENNLRRLSLETFARWDKSPPATLEEARAAAAAACRTLSMTNLLLGGPIREEDSPGNYEIRPDGAKFRFVLFDVNGAEVTP